MNEQKPNINLSSSIGILFSFRSTIWLAPTIPEKKKKIHPSQKK